MNFAAWPVLEKETNILQAYWHQPCKIRSFLLQIVFIYLFRFTRSSWPLHMTVWLIGIIPFTLFCECSMQNPQTLAFPHESM